MYRSHVIHIPEEQTDKDMSRPIFDRPPGRIGIYIELEDAEPVDPHEYGSHVYFLRDTEDKLNSAIRQVPLSKIKGSERCCLLNDVIFEEYHDGVIISVGFEDVAAVDDLWHAYERQLLTPCLQEALITEQVLSRTAVTSLKLECRIWEDEIEACREEIKLNKVSPIKLETSTHGQEMIKVVKRYIPTLAEHVLMLKDTLNRFDQSLGEFIMIMKQNLPKEVDKICTYKQFLELADEIRKKKPDSSHNKILSIYAKVRDHIKLEVREFEDHVLHPLLQVHGSCETLHQREIKGHMRAGLRETRERLKPDYDFYQLNHKEWQAKVLLNEQKLFLGLISVLASSVTTLLEADTQTDEYLSALPIKIKI
ncbi:hypothetical protein LSH36_40g09022 [Paralvinella palmiformis]|uniref:Uncharacterized protein n=1 Tax=Paralvinella palmiformis TaxID=53620 RepID=A0AAD9K7I8_9ANNE|nr:hypothetical protein LSH36_40g09022 [Paralvinella palmiformis]